MPPGDVRWWRAVLVLVVVGGAALRIHPLARYPGLELMEYFPRNAAVAVAERHWEPVWVHHGAGLFDALRVVYTAWYAAGRSTGAYHDRLDLLAAFLRDPQPFVLAGRAVVVACAVLSIVLVAYLGRRLFDATAGVAGAALLAVTFIHVRGSHQVWPDVPAAAAVLATVAAALRALERESRGAVALTGALGAVALATKQSMFAVALPVALGAWLAPGASRRERVLRLAVAALAAAVTFVVLCPYTIRRLPEALGMFAQLRAVLFADAGHGLSLPALLYYGQGTGIVLLGAAGFAAACVRPSRARATALAFGVAYLALLARSTTIYARYLAPLAPFVALCAGHAAALLGRRLAPAHPLAVSAALVLAAGAGPLAQSLAYDAFLARPDTRELAGAWLRAHVPPGTAIAIPNAVDYPNPRLPVDAGQIRFAHPTHAASLLARGLGDPARTYPRRYLAFFERRAGHPPDAPYVVEAQHPVVCHDMSMPAPERDALVAAGARPVARFTGFTDPLPAGVVFDPVEADYVPLAGFSELERPGPNLTIWAMPGAPTT